MSDYILKEIVLRLKKIFEILVVTVVIFLVYHPELDPTELVFSMIV